METAGSSEPLRATDNVTYFPVLGGWRAERAAGFVVRDDEEVIDWFDTESEAYACAAKTADATASELVSVQPIEAGTEYIYLAPRLETDDGVPNVFVYQGANGDPAWDEPIQHYVMFDHHCSECGLAHEDGHMPGCSKGAM